MHCRARYTSSANVIAMLYSSMPDVFLVYSEISHGNEDVRIMSYMMSSAGAASVYIIQSVPALPTVVNGVMLHRLTVVNVL